MGVVLRRVYMDCGMACGDGSCWRSSNGSTSEDYSTPRKLHGAALSRINLEDHAGAPKALDKRLPACGGGGHHAAAAARAAVAALSRAVE